MAATQLPDVKQKQRLLFSEKLTAEAWIDLGQRFLEAGWFNDAIDFFARAEHQEGLGRVREIAREQGDTFLLTRCLKALAVEAEDREWAALGDRALALGKWQFAREAYRLAGDRKAMDRIDALIKPANPEPEPGEPPAESA